MEMTREGLKKHLERIEELNAKLKEVRMERSSFSTKGKSDGIMDDAGEQYNYEQEAMLTGLINDEMLVINQAVIVNHEQVPEDCITVDDTVLLSAQYGSEEPFEMFVTLSDSFSLDKTITPVSLNSPIGKAIYAKPIGAIVECETPAGKAVIQIIAKNQERGR